MASSSAAAGSMVTRTGEGFGVRFDTSRGAGMRRSHSEFIRQFEVPTPLRDVNVPHEELSRVAGTVLAELERARSVGANVTVESLVTLLEAAY